MNEDPVQIMDDTLKEFAQRPYTETRKDLGKSVKRPVNPAARKLSKQERDALDLAWLQDPMAVMATADEEAARYQLPDGMIPKEVWERIKRASKL